MTTFHPVIQFAAYPDYKLHLQLVFIQKVYNMKIPNLQQSFATRHTPVIKFQPDVHTKRGLSHTCRQKHMHVEQ